MTTDHVKAILYVYPKMEELIEAIAVSIGNRAVLSYRSGCGALEDCEKLCEDILLQKKLLLLKEQIDLFLQSLSQEELFLLEYRFFRRKKILMRSSFVLNCSERGYFRKQERVLKKAAAYFAALGMTEERFSEDFANSVCMKKVYKAVKGGEELRIYPRRDTRGLKFQDSRFSGGTVFFPSATKTAITSTATEARVIRTI